MEKQESLGAAGSLKGASPGGATRDALGGIGGVEGGAGLPPGVIMVHGSGPPAHPGGTAVLDSGLHQHPGEVAGHSHGSGTHPGGFSPPFPGTSVSGTSNLGSGGPGMYNSGSIPRPGSTCTHPDKPCEDRPRSILKNSSSIMMHKSPRAERRKSQHWDEMNILATYHPADKDYGFMKVDEPSTPYHRLQDSEEDLLAGTSYAMTPEELAERLATMDDFCPKVLLYSDHKSFGSSDNFSKTQPSDFEKRRKAHYNEGKYLKAQKNLPLDPNKGSHVGGLGVGSASRGVMLDPELRPAERSGAGGLTRGVKDEIGLAARNHILEAKGGRKSQIDLRDSSDSPAFRSQSQVSATPVTEKEMELQRKEYYRKGRYLRCSPHPELEEDTEDEQQSSSANLNWVIESPVGTEVRLLDHKRSPPQDHRAPENSVKVTVTPVKPGPAPPFKDSGSQAMSGWCQWLVSKGLNWQSAEGSERDAGRHPNLPSQDQHRHETLRLRWTQEEETRQWKT
uniref:Protein phosphatase inhibitor 2 n=1 Tax=Sus scrofa TaxID=9823 RepID=A0A8D1VL77_PIG